MAQGSPERTKPPRFVFQAQTEPPIVHPLHFQEEPFIPHTQQVWISGTAPAPVATECMDTTHTPSHRASFGILSCTSNTQGPQATDLYHSSCPSPAFLP